jgi:hypothetical protein
MPLADSGNAESTAASVVLGAPQVLPRHKLLIESGYEIGIGAPYRFDPAAGAPELFDTLRLDVGAGRMPHRVRWFLVQFTRPSSGGYCLESACATTSEGHLRRTLNSLR